MWVPVPNPEDAPRPDLGPVLNLPRLSGVPGTSESRGPRIAGASLFLIFFATLPFIWVTLSYDCGPSEDVTGIQLVTGDDITIKGSQSNVMIGYDETVIDGIYRLHPSFRMMLLFVIIIGSFASIFLSDGGYSLRVLLGTVASLVALSFAAGSTGSWEGQGPPPDSEVAFGPLAAFVVFLFATIANARMANRIADATGEGSPSAVVVDGLVFSFVVTFLVSLVALVLIVLFAILTYEG